MTPFKFPPFKNRRNAPPASFHGTPPQSAQQPTAMQPVQPDPLAALEQKMEAEAKAKVLKTYPMQPSPRRPVKRMVNKVVWMAILLGIPLGGLWIVNLPYPPIRRPVARTAPILLLPSYISMDYHYREALSLVEQAAQLIDQPTSPADIELGEQKVQQAQTSLDKLPIHLLYDFHGYSYRWYSWRFSLTNFNAARSRVGELESKVFQEKNAQTALLDAEQALTVAKQQYQQAVNSVDQQRAIATWRSALDQLSLLPVQTLAGRTAEAKLEAYRREFQETVGLAAGDEQTHVIIVAAKEFAMRAAEAGQDPPHTASEWARAEAHWEEAIVRLNRVPAEDVAGYAEAQRLMAEYQDNLEQIRIRRQAEVASVDALQEAQVSISRLQANANVWDQNQMFSELQMIINELNQVQNGTTAYAEAQSLLSFAQNKLSELQP